MARVLIIEDEVDFRRVLAQTLQKHGYETADAGDTEEGFRLAAELRPDLIISDVCMSGGDGFALLARIRGDSRTSSVPFIIMTGQPDFDGMTTVSEFAADGYLVKPFKLQTLITVVANRLEREAVLQNRANEIRAQLQRILEASPDLIGIIDPTSFRFLFLNASGRRLLAVPPEGDISALHIDEVHAPEAADLLKTSAIPIALEENIWAGENSMRTLTGRQVPVQQFIQAHRDSQGEITFLSTIAHDLTENKKSESALRASESRFRLLLDSLPDAVMMHDHCGKLLFSNARTEELFGYPPEQMSQVAAESFFSGRPSRVFSSRNLSAHVESSCRHKDGEEMPVDLFTHDLKINGEPTRLSIIRDLSDRKRLERERQNIEIKLQHALRLESIGQLAAGIAHEINTPVQYIGDNTRFLKEAFQSLAKLLPEYEKVVQASRHGALAPETLQAFDECLAEADVDYLLKEIPLAIQQSLEGTERVAKIVRSMKDFSHPGVTEKTMASLNQLIESTLTVARNEWKYVANLETDFDPELPLVPCLPGEFNQVILNLVVNAAHSILDVVGKEAINGKGKISVVTRRDDGCAEVRITDTGTGIPPHLQSKIFEPFFTTKEVGKGTGQGLAISRSVIVDKHGGTIHFETEAGKGTSFIVRLPLKPLEQRHPTTI